MAIEALDAEYRRRLADPNILLGVPESLITFIGMQVVKFDVQVPEQVARGFLLFGKFLNREVACQHWVASPTGPFTDITDSIHNVLANELERIHALHDFLAYEGRGQGKPITDRAWPTYVWPDRNDNSRINVVADTLQEAMPTIGSEIEALRKATLSDAVLHDHTIYVQNGLLTSPGIKITEGQVLEVYSR